MSTEKKKSNQVSFTVPRDLVEALDEWVRWQRESRAYKVDRSHVMCVLLRRFLEKNRTPRESRREASDGVDFSEKIE